MFEVRRVVRQGVRREAVGDEAAPGSRSGCDEVLARFVRTDQLHQRREAIGRLPEPSDERDVVLLGSRDGLGLADVYLRAQRNRADRRGTRVP